MHIAKRKPATFLQWFWMLGFADDTLNQSAGNTLGNGTLICRPGMQARVSSIARRGIDAITAI
jgi:hypothetical protein